jgi:hypothetical protein
VLVAFLAAMAPGVVQVKSKSTFRPSTAAISAGSRSR